MKSIFLNVEIAHDCTLEEHGLYNFADADESKLLHMAYCVDFGQIEEVDFLNGEQLPESIKAALIDPTVIKYAYNAQFVRLVVSRLYSGIPFKYISPANWRCLKIWAASLGLPTNLRKLMEMLKLTAPEGFKVQNILRSSLFSGFRCADAVNILSVENASEWTLLKMSRVNVLDAEIDLHAVLSNSPMSDAEWNHYWINQTIADRGILIDSTFAKHASILHHNIQKEDALLFQQITGMPVNPDRMNPASFLTWLKKQGVHADSLTQAKVDKLRRTTTGRVYLALGVWQNLSHTSPQKYQRLLNTSSYDSCVRGLIGFNNGHCGGFGCNVIQIENLPVCRVTELSKTRSDIRNTTAKHFVIPCASFQDVLSQLLSTTFVPHGGNVFYKVSYLYATDRILMWLNKRMEKNWTQDGQETLLDRSAISKNLMSAAVSVISDPSAIRMYGLNIKYESGALTVQLPSRRVLMYRNPSLTIRHAGGCVINYVAYDASDNPVKKVLTASTLLQDILNGILRDYIADAMMNYERNNLNVVLHFSNSILLECTQKDTFRVHLLATHRPKWAVSLDIPCSFHSYSRYYEKSQSEKTK